MDNKDPLNNLIKYAQKDFKGTIQNPFEDFEAALEKSIKECGRSIEDQKLEAMSVLAEKKNDKSSERVSTSLAFASIAFSIMSNVWDDVTLFILGVALFIGTIVILSFNSQRKSSKIIAYYTIKLYCIEKQLKSVDNANCENVDKSKKVTSL